MNILLSGASGFLGSAAAAHLEAHGHTVIRLSRRPGHDAIVWDVPAARIDPLPPPIDAVVHLAGENIFGRWSRAKKDRIYTSRVAGTRLLAGHLAAMTPKPKVLICASAVGYYGSRGDEILTEDAACGTGFLSRTCRDWEAAADPARQAGIRVVNLRLGMVLDARGGALAKMLPAFKMALGGPVGSGRQWLSWISLTDVLRIIDVALTNAALSGPVNAVAPEPVQNRTFAKTLGHTLRRPARLPLPAVLLKIALGRFAEETLLSSARAVPQKLQTAGFQFTHPALTAALSDCLK